MPNFAKGMRAFKKHINAPDFIIAELLIDLNEFVEWAEQNSKQSEIKITIKEGKSGNYYAALNDYVPKTNTETEEASFDTKEVPF